MFSMILYTFLETGVYKPPGQLRNLGLSRNIRDSCKPAAGSLIVLLRNEIKLTWQASRKCSGAQGQMLLCRHWPWPHDCATKWKKFAKKCWQMKKAKLLSWKRVLCKLWPFLLFSRSAVPMVTWCFVKLSDTHADIWAGALRKSYNFSDAQRSCFPRQFYSRTDSIEDFLSISSSRTPNDHRITTDLLN